MKLKRRKRGNSGPLEVSAGPSKAATRRVQPALHSKTSKDQKPVTVPFSWQLSCHRNAARSNNSNTNSDPTERTNLWQKKVNCPFILDARLVMGDDGEIEIEVKEVNGHHFHTPGSIEDMPYLLLSKEISQGIIKVSCQRIMCFFPLNFHLLV